MAERIYSVICIVGKVIMTLGVIGRKCGMTRVFQKSGESIPVTVIAVEPNLVTQIKSTMTDGYCALQVSVGNRGKKLNKPEYGHYSKSSISLNCGYKTVEFRVTESELDAMKLGNRLSLDRFRPKEDNSIDKDVVAAEKILELKEKEKEKAEKKELKSKASKKEKKEKKRTIVAKKDDKKEQQDNLRTASIKVDVTGVSRGKGYAGVVKRWNFKTQDATHGNSLSHRAAGSIGQCQTPGRVFRGKKMAGQMGDKKVTVQNLEVIRVDKVENSDIELLLIRGAVPGAPGQDVIVRPSVKSNSSSSVLI